jgi:ABC-2 type transport system ATP-binding protein
VKTFSGGMKRRLNLAAGDLHDPPLLLLDEPTAGVDPQSRHHLFESLESLRAGGKTLLYTTHYMEEAQRLCDRIAIVDGGRVLAIGTAAQLAEQAGLTGADLEAVFLKLTGRRLRDE